MEVAFEPFEISRPIQLTVGLRNTALSFVLSLYATDM